MSGFNEAERAHFRALQHKEDKGTLYLEEADELSLLNQKLEQQELELLAPTLSRMDEAAERVQTQQQTLNQLAERKEALVTRLESLLAEVQTERQALEEAVSRVMNNDMSNGRSVSLPDQGIPAQAKISAC